MLSILFQNASCDTVDTNVSHKLSMERLIRTYLVGDGLEQVKMPDNDGMVVTCNGCVTSVSLLTDKLSPSSVRSSQLCEI